MERIDARTETLERVVNEVAAVVLGGGIVIFPTDTVYGIGCDPARAASVERLYVLKSRSRAKPLTLHLASVAEFLEYTAGRALATIAARQFLPGALTVIVARPSFVDGRVTGGLPSLGLRVPADALCSAILERTGPLAATSANISGEPAFIGEGEYDRLPAADLVVDAGPTQHRTESTILDLSQPEPRVLREGTVTVSQLERYLGPIIRRQATEQPAGGR